MLAWTQFGTASDSPPLVIAHGLFGSGRNWGALARKLSDRGRVVTVDMRNHGESPWENAHDYKGMAADLAEVIDAVGAPADVLGHSMGGKAAMALALMHPDLVTSLVVADIAPVPYDHGQMRYIDAMRAIDLDDLNSRSEAAERLAPLIDPPDLAGFFAQSIDLKNRKWRLNLDVLAREMPRILSFPDDLDTPYPGPALFLSGAESEYVKREYRPEIKRLFPAAQFAAIPGAGHWLHAEKPHEVEAAIRVWLDRETGTGDAR